jgi:hypothetical protein
VAHIIHPQNQAAVLEPQLIQWIEYLAGQTLSWRTDTVWPGTHLEKPKNQIMRQFLTISQFPAGGFVMGLE